MERIFRALFLMGFALLPVSNRISDVDSNAFLVVSLPLISGLYSPGLILLWLATIAGFACWLQRGAALPRSGGGYVLLGCFFVALIFSLLPGVPDFRASGIRGLSHLLGLLLFTLLLLHDWKIPSRVESQNDSNFGLMGLTVLGVVLSLYYIANTAVQANQGGLQSVIYSRFTGGINSLPWGASNIVASVLVLALGSATILFNSTGRASKYILTICIIGAGILATLSRNAIVCFGLIAVIYTVILGRKRVLGLFGIGVSGVVIWLFLHRENLMGDIIETRTGDKGELISIGGRFEIWGHYLDRLRERPFGFNGLYSSIVEFGFSPHNWFLVTYWELGLIGVVSGFGLVFGPIVQLWKRLVSVRRMDVRADLLTISVAFVAFLNIQSEDPQFSHQYIISWWVWLAALVLEANKDRRRVAQ
jgi:O-antigen ligase